MGILRTSAKYLGALAPHAVSNNAPALTLVPRRVERYALVDEARLRMAETIGNTAKILHGIAAMVGGDTAARKHDQHNDGCARVLAIAPSAKSASGTPIYALVDLPAPKVREAATGVESSAEETVDECAGQLGAVRSRTIALSTDSVALKDSDSGDGPVAVGSAPMGKEIALEEETLSTPVQGSAPKAFEATDTVAWKAPAEPADATRIAAELPDKDRAHPLAALLFAPPLHVAKQVAEATEWGTNMGQYTPTLPCVDDWREELRCVFTAPPAAPATLPAAPVAATVSPALAGTFRRTANPFLSVSQWIECKYARRVL